MKVLALLFLVGYASASFYDALDQASDELVLNFMVGMEKSPSLSEFIGYSEEADQIEEDIKTQLGKTLKESLDAVLEKIRATVAQGKEVGKDLVEKAKVIADRLKEIGVDAGSKAKDLIASIKEKAKDWLKSLLEKLGLGKRSVVDWLGGLLGEFDLQALLQKLKNKLAEKINIESITAYLKKLFGNSAVGNILLGLVKTKGLQALKDLVARILPSSISGIDYSLIDMWEQIKDFFSGLGVQIKDKFSKFADWLRETVKTGFENAKDQAAKIKVIAKEVIDHSKNMSKEAAREALEFLEPYKKDLGVLWDQVKETVNRVIGRSDF